MPAALRPGMLTRQLGRGLACSSSLLGRLAALGLVTLAAGGCHRSDAESQDASTSIPSAAAPSAAPVAAPVEEKKPFAPSRAGCETVPVFTAGQANGSVCADDVAAAGLTVIDLSDAWTPRVFAPDPETGSAPEYRAKYLELANQANADLGLYGIAPSVSAVAGRLADEKRRTCDAAVDLAPLGELRAARAAAPDARAAAALMKAPEGRAAILAAQGELVCAGLLKKGAATGTMSASTESALDAFRRRHMIIGAGLDEDTLAALALGGDELELRALLRVLRERVADAGGLLEDGSAAGEHALVADRDIDLTAFAPPAERALENGAPDLVGAAADKAARELGWTSPDAARAFFAAFGKAGAHELRVAVALPAAPAYHAKAMDLRVEIDRGDVFYEMPGQAAAARRRLGEVQRPSFVVYAKDGDHERPLIRWSTTIGGWKQERTEEGEVALKYKESDVGDRVWRQILAAPAWLPPDSTPETDLVHEAKDGSLAVKRDLIQPGYRNAYGLVMLIHHEPVVHGSETRYLDHGIRTHGSVDYKSIRRGESHGCHRLYNQLALRVSGFLLEHRSHVRRGKVNVGYHRTIERNDHTAEIDVPSRGYLYELEPPVPVRVLPGRIAGERQKPVSSVVPIATDARAKG
jgi:hypothetical protein